MPNYKEMYLTMVRASEAATRILIEAQRSCEETYLAEEPLSSFPKFPEGAKQENEK